ncbi:MAG: PKD domain-containing protein, partial [Chitinophagaceae bacterium]
MTKKIRDVVSRIAMKQLITFFFVIYSFTICAFVNIPYQINPKNNSVFSSGTLIFTWNQTEGNLSYHFQISENIEFIPLVADELISDETEIEFDFSESGQYFWRLRSCDNGDCYEWSPAYSFTIFNPSDISENILWLDAGGEILKNDNSVYQWIDMSGNGNHAEQAETLNQPIFIENAFNNKPAIDFDGTSHFFTGTELNNIHQSSFTTFIVADGGTVSGSLQLPFFLISPFPDGYWITRNVGNQKFNVINRNFQSSSGDLFNSGFSKKIFQTKKTINTQLQGYINTHEVFSTTASNAISPFTNNNYHIGYANYQFIGYYKGKIAEILIYNKAVNDQETHLINTYLRQKYSKQLDLGEDVKVDYGFEPISIIAPEGFTNYLWSNGSINNSIIANETSLIWLTANDSFGLNTSDTIRVFFPNVNLTATNSIICKDSTVFLTTKLPNPELYSFEWSNGAGTSLIEVEQPGNYWVKVTDTLGYYNYSDTIFLALDDFASNISLGPDIELCSGNSIGLVETDPDSEIISYLWNTNEITPEIVITQTGNYTLTVINENGCIAEDSIFVEIIGTAPSVDFGATTSCLGTETIFTDLSEPAEDDELNSWLWEFENGFISNEPNPNFTFNEPGIFDVTLTVIANSTCQASIVKPVEVLFSPQAIFSKDTTCINIPVQLIDQSLPHSDGEIISWMWVYNENIFSTEQNPFITFEKPGSFEITLIVESSNGCTDTTSNFVYVYSNFQPPTNFSLIHPKNNQIIEHGFIHFSWNESSFASYYSLQVALDESFEDIIIEVDGLEDTNYSLEIGHGKYYWRVAAFNLCMDSTRSEIIKFISLNPVFIDGLSLWLRGDVFDSIDNKVTQWTDLSGENNHALQMIASQRPGITTFLNKPALDFTPNQYLIIDAVQELNPENFTYIALGERRGTTAGAIISSVIPSWWGTQISTTSAAFQFFKGNGTISSFATNYDMSRPWLVKFNNNNPNGEIYINNLFHGNFLKEVSYSELSNITIGRSSAGTSANYFNGKLAEILIFNRALDETELNKITGYIQAKYSPPINLGPDRNTTYGF